MRTDDWKALEFLGLPRIYSEFHRNSKLFTNLFKEILGVNSCLGPPRTS